MATRVFHLSTIPGVEIPRQSDQSESALAGFTNCFNATSQRRRSHEDSVHHILRLLSNRSIRRSSASKIGKAMGKDREPVVTDDWNISAPVRLWAIFLVSLLTLFLEMLLIRWLGTEIRIFAYLQNTVLVVCFLGMGMGCFTCRQPIGLRSRLLIPLLVLTLVLAIPISRTAVARISELLSVLGDLLIWHHAISDSPWQTIWHVSLGLGLTFVLMLLIWEMFVPLGRILGRLMDDHPRTIVAYSVNIAGSLLGIWLFVGMSAFYLSPVVWFVALALMLVFFVGSGLQRWANLGLVGATVVLAYFASTDHSAFEIMWSPYQKLALKDTGDKYANWQGKYIEVNNVGYQEIIDLSESGVRKHPNLSAADYRMSQYDIPLRLHESPHDVLIVGAGSGNDAAGALRNGAQRVTAVEIDPAIVELGRRYHPEKPYQSPCINVVIDDARSHFATTKEKYDLIVFGLLDSHTTTTMTNARLDHYVYTTESFRRAKSLLKEGGMLVLSFQAVKPYITNRMANGLREVFGHRPMVFCCPPSGAGWGGILFVTGDEDTLSSALATQPELAQQINKWQSETPVNITYGGRLATDDWPYIYLESARIPTLYYLLAGMLAGLFVYGCYRLKSTSTVFAWTTTHWHFFFLGAAFMLLEVQNISKAAVVLGNTWWVNAVIISGILVMILGANVVAAVWPRLPQSLATSCLILSCLALFFVDLSSFGFLPYLTKSLLIGTLTTVPIFFAGILFIRSFAVTRRKDLALGANLMGALVGGLLQSVTFFIGIKALLLLVAILYAIAMLTKPKYSTADASSATRLPEGKTMVAT